MEENVKTRVCKCCGKELPITEFGTDKNRKDGLKIHCKRCLSEKQKERNHKLKELATIGEKGGKKLSDYSPRELMQELYKRGYRGTLEYTEVHKIDISNF